MNRKIVFFQKLWKLVLKKVHIEQKKTLPFISKKSHEPNTKTHPQIKIQTKICTDEK